MFKLFSREPVHDPLASPAPGAVNEIKTTTCYMCACRCGIRVHLRDGELRYIDGNPEHPLNKGVICAKGASGIMKQVSPARLTQPLLRKPGSARGAGEFEPISWERTFQILGDRLAHIRATDPRKFALFTGRDQMQALTGLFARQFGTPNYAAHGGFCSVNMAAGMIYTIGGSFWEFGGPDLDRAKLFVMIGTAEDHHSNPLKMALGKFKRGGGRFVSINPVRTGYSAIADEWIPIKPGTDGALFMALLHVLIADDLIDRTFLKRFTNAPQLVLLETGCEREGMFAHDPDPAKGLPGDGREPHNKLVFDTVSKTIVAAYPEGIAEGADPALEGHYTLDDGRKVAPSFQLLRERVAPCTPAWASAITGIPAERITKLARELGETALHQAFELPIPWTDAWGKRHETTQARPVAFHAMRGLAAHSNGFQTIRALAVLMSVLGTIDAPGGFRHKAPYPRHIVPNFRAFNSPEMIKPNTPLNAAPLGFPASPEELAIHADGSPMRIDHAFSWEHPLSAHGLMHTVITNATRGDPYRIDTLMIFMANMAWNSTMNTMAVRDMLNAKNADGDFQIPFLVVCDAFQSEMVAFADLVLPDTTYLERHDVMSMLDRPISEFEGPVDSVRIPVVPPTGQCKPFQEVIVELASRLKFPAFTTADGNRKFKDYPDFVVNFEAQPGVGFLMGWRGADGTEHLRGAPNPKQWEMYAKNNCVFQYHLPESMHFMRNWNREYLDFAKAKGWRQKNDVIQLQLYSDTLQSFRLAAQGKTKGRQPPEHLRERIDTYFDPLPFWYPPLEYAATDTATYPLNAITQRPMAMYHSWDSQNAWLRQIHSHNYLQVNPLTAHRAGIADGGWCWVESQWGQVRCMLRYSEAVEPGTVWTWNAIGKADGAWQLAPGADESRKGFLLNHLISEELPHGAGRHISNSDPVTGQAGWYDVRVRIRPAEPEEVETSSPQIAATPAAPGVLGPRQQPLDYFAGKRRVKGRGMIDWLKRMLQSNALAEAPARSAGHASSHRDAPTTIDPATIGTDHGPSKTLAKQLALVIDLNVCVGCHACVTSCKEWNTSGSAGPLVDQNAYGANPTGTFFNRVQTYEAGVFPLTETIHFPKSCLHCEEPPCVPVCPTGASYKRAEDGIVLVDYDKCIGCKYCAWACPYGAREIDEERQVMTKCTLCVDRVYDDKLSADDRQPACVKACPTGARLFGDVKDPDSEVSKAIRERGGYSLMPEWDTQPANQYLPRRPTAAVGATTPMPSVRDVLTFATTQ